MIPVKLVLRNFMAYQAEETLDFSDIHIACLSGENGAGKSSLLDAMTWSLWGKARVSQNDNLIHLGETEMTVEFSFQLGTEIYRVLRKRSSSGRGKSELHFQVADAGGWRTLTETSMRTTQAKIDRLLRLDYDTFINSAFLLQGRADEFTNKTPRERKQILGDILGLGIYDEYADLARDEVNYYRQEIGIIEGQISRIEEELAREPQYQAELNESRSRAVALRKKREAAEHQLNELRQQHRELTLKQDQLTDLEQRLAQTQTDIDDLRKGVADTKAGIVAQQAVLARQAEIEAGAAQLEQAEQALTDWNQRLAQSAPLIEDRHQLQTAINQARSRLEGDRRLVQARLNEQKPKAERLPALQEEVAQLAQTVAELQALEEERDSQRRHLNDLNTETARLGEENKQLKGEMDRIKSRLTQLEAAGSVCPVCTQPLSEDHRRQVQAEFVTEGTAKGDRYRANTARLSEVQSDSKACQQKLEQTERKLRQLARQQTLLATRQQALQEAEQAQADMGELTDELAGLEAALADDTFALAEASRLAAVETQLTELGYDRQAHQAVRDAVDELAHWAAEKRRLEDAATRLTDLDGRLTQDQARLDRLLAQTDTDRQTVARLQAETATLEGVARELTQTSRQVDQLEREAYTASQAQMAAEQKLNWIAEQAKARSDKEESLAELKKMQGIYQDLRVAFGKNGVQALLIENTIPELEDEANNILARMTDGRMHLQFITQRETKSGQSLVETLDIRIADEVGTRNYELYSGGEAFRVNFAIRIALSKLLARRAGARLQTLVIDEGFGTQDAQGRERLVEAINKIQDDFEKVIVITHIEELKDAFPTRITVQKTVQGSKISLF